MKDKKDKIKYIIYSVLFSIALLLIIIGGCFYYNNNALGQIKSFEKDIQNNNYKGLADRLSNNENELTQDDAKNFVEYVKSSDNKSRYRKEMSNIKANIKKNSNSTLNYGSITDDNHNKLVTIRKNGKKFFIIDRLEFKPKLTDVYVKDYNNTAWYKFNSKDIKNVLSEQNQLTKVGSFLIGNYKIKSEKNIKDGIINGKSTGYLEFNTTVKNSENKVIANENFNQTWFKVKLNNSSLLDKDTIKLVIDNHKTEYHSTNVYGKYYNPTELKVYAIGKLDGKEFKTNEVLVRRNYKQDPQNLNLEFKKNEIETYQKESKKIKNNSESYIKDYIKDLNKAYDKRDYKYISKYIKEESNLEKQLKTNIKSKKDIKFKKVKINNIQRFQNKVSIDLTKMNGNNLTKSKYILIYDETEKDFMIEKIE